MTAIVGAKTPLEEFLGVLDHHAARMEGQIDLLSSRKESADGIRNPHQLVVSFRNVVAELQPQSFDKVAGEKDPVTYTISVNVEGDQRLELSLNLLSMEVSFRVLPINDEAQVVPGGTVRNAESIGVSYLNIFGVERGVIRIRSALQSNVVISLLDGSIRYVKI